MAERFDAAIVGAGPAGASLAIRLAAAGRHVLLVEKKSFPRPKLCGEFISPECLDHFEELCVAAKPLSIGVEIDRTVFFARSGRCVAVESEWFGAKSPRALSLSRAAMDTALLKRASDAGVDVREETSANALPAAAVVAGLRLRDSSSETDISADLYIDATGRSRILARQVGTENAVGRATHVAFKTHVRNAAIDPSCCEIYGYAGGYGGCNQIEHGLFNLCFIVSAEEVKRRSSDADRVVNEIVRSNRRAATTLADIEKTADWLAVAIERYGRGHPAPAGNLLAVGDAAAFIDPFTGSGMLLALESAKIAATAILGHPATTVADEYARAYRRAFDRRLSFCSILRHTSVSPLLAESLIAILGVSAGLRRRLAHATRR